MRLSPEGHSSRQIALSLPGKIPPGNITAMKRTFHIHSSAGLRLHATEWLPASEPCGILIVVHGLSDHAGRFEHYASYFNNAGYGVYCCDLMGNGRSEGKRGHFPALDPVMADMGLFMKEVRSLFPSLPVFLYGQSMGGNLVLNFGIRRKPSVRGIIASSPWLRLAKPPPAPARMLASLIAGFLPSLIIPNGIDPSDLSHNEAVAKAYAEDPLVHRKISMKTFAIITRSGEYAIEQAATLEVPFLLLHGTDDRITSHAASEDFFNRLAGEQNRFVSWPGLYHELHNEFEKEKVLGTILEWMERLQDR
jgi:alpha-beta hydrolase superfamily lysophospholipase